MYIDLHTKFGNNIKTLNWGSKESQYRRFNILNQIGDLQNQSLLDVGCGFADLYDFLKDKKIEVNYTGLDITEPILEDARKKFPLVKFINDSLLNLPESSMFDYVFASGIYTYRSEKEYEYIEDMTKSMFAHCIKGVAFNCLSQWADTKDEGEFYADPCTIIEIGHKLTKRLVMRHDYQPNDFTIYLYK